MTTQSAPPMCMLPAALALATRGISVFPVRIATKKPMVPWGREATTDPGVIGRWWARWPHANIGVACKPSGLTIVDVDGPVGRASWATLTGRHGGHVPTASVTTGRADGGVHYWYRAPAVDPPGNSTGSDTGGIAPGVDLRGAGTGDGGMAIAPPSLHASGRRYQWADRLPLADLPAWLHQLATRPTTPAPSNPAQIAAARRRATAYRHRPDLATSRAHRWAAAVLAGESADLAVMAPESGRSDALNGAAYKLGRLVAGGLLDEADVRLALVDAGVAAGLDDPARKGKGGSAARTVESGLRAGMRRPRTCVEDR
ncbi:bifunctional DNA primase/polymerase [Frankia sp. AgB32]|uniref:bifunctional DNA primase/polymerase n=1 Tax=Frankia sp. AgB32 TaxID=631119 RepID=UPI0020109B8A|nr:bifunctional DNA primase/polymerase [Frankia sp. AgB32]MCK9898298.1 bifunctional DNA primase/polymerase [Frankia sp. AgB32]